MSALDLVYAALGRTTDAQSWLKFLDSGTSQKIKGVFNAKEAPFAL